MRQRQIQLNKSLLDKEVREEAALKKLIQETRDRGDEMNLKRANKFEDEVNKWISSLLGRIDSGGFVFYEYIKVIFQYCRCFALCKNTLGCITTGAFATASRD